MGSPLLGTTLSAAHPKQCASRGILFSTGQFQVNFTLASLRFEMIHFDKRINVLSDHQKNELIKQSVV